MDNRISLLEFPERIDSWQRILPYALLGAVTLALYAPTLYFDFVWDDANYILYNYWIQGWSIERLRDIWTRSYLGNYAPLHHMALALVYSFSGLEPFGYHLAQLMLHTACVCLLYFVLKGIESPRVAWLASLLYAVFPPNVENVAWVSETKSSLALLFFLLSFRAFQRLRERGRWTDGVWSASFLVLSLLSKINTVVAPAIFFLYDYKEGRPRKCVMSLAGFFLISVAFVSIHFVSTQGINREAEGLVDSALTSLAPPHPGETGGYFGGAAVHLLNLPSLLLFYVRMNFFPYPLSAWHMFPIYGELNWVVGAAWVALLGLLWILYRSPRDVQFWMLWFFLFLSPVLQVVPLPIWVADRYLYVPAIGAFVLGSKLFFHIFDRLAKPWLRLAWEAALAAVLLAFAWQVHSYLPVWRNDLTLWESTTNTCMTSAYCHYRLGIALLDDQVERGVLELAQAVQIHPVPLYWIPLADALSDNAGDYGRALQAYQATQESGRRLSVTFLAKVAKTHYLSGNLEQAATVIATGQSIQPDNSALFFVQGFVQWKLGNRQAAKHALQEGLRLNAVNPETAHPARFLMDYWRHPAEVGRLLADLGPL